MNLRSILRYRVGVRSLEDVYGGLIRVLRVSGIGIVLSPCKGATGMRVYRRFKPKGKVFFFKDTSVKELEEFRDRVLFLVSDAKAGDENIDFERNVGVYYFELEYPSKWVKRRFKPLEVYRGRICIGRRCEKIKWMIYVPTYNARSYLFLCHPQDLEREEGTRITYPLINLVSSYLRSKKTSIANLKTTPLFL